MKGPTKRQSQILALMNATLGQTLSMREIARLVGLSSPATVHKHVQNLKKSGLFKSSKSKVQKPAQIAIIGSIAKGKKIELFAKASSFDLPPSVENLSKTLYGFIIKDHSFADLMMAAGDLIIVEAKQEPTFKELVLAHSKETGVSIGTREELLDLQIQGSILYLIRNYSSELSGSKLSGSKSSSD